MKRLVRRKKAPDDPPNTKATSIEASHLSSAPQAAANETPLFAKFATTHKTKDGAKPIVSGPMALSAKASFSSSSTPRERRPSESRLRRTASRQDSSSEPSRFLTSSPPPRTSSRNIRDASSHSTSSNFSLAVRTSYSQETGLNTKVVSPSEPIHPAGSQDRGMIQLSTSEEPYNRQRTVSPAQARTARGDAHVSDAGVHGLLTVPSRASSSVSDEKGRTGIINHGTDDEEYDPYRKSIFGEISGHTTGRSIRSTAEVSATPQKLPSTSTNHSSHVAGPPRRVEEDLPPPAVPPKLLPPTPIASVRTPSESPSLKVSPGATKKKYSPLAAFGLPLSHSGSSHSTSTVSIASSRTPIEQAQPDVDRLIPRGNHPEVPLERRGDLPASSRSITQDNEVVGIIQGARQDSRSNASIAANTGALEAHSSASQAEHESDLTRQAPPLLDQTQASSQIRTTEQAESYPVENEQSAANILAQSPPGSSQTKSLPSVPLPTMPGLMPSIKDSTLSKIIPKASRSHRRMESTSKTQPSQSRSAEVASSSHPPAMSGPVRGRPLIFAAMSGSEPVEDDAEPSPGAEQASQMDSQTVGRVNEPSAQPYPSPTSPDESQWDLVESPPHLPEQPTEPEPRRRRKLSKPNKHTPRAMEVDAVVQNSADVDDQRTSRPRHSEKPVASVEAQPPASLLESPIQLQQKRSHGEDLVQQNNGRKRSSSGERTKLTRRPREGTVKTLTGKQLEKLNARNTTHSPPVTASPLPATPPISPVTPETHVAQLPSPPSPEEYAQARSRRRGDWLEKVRPVHVAGIIDSPSSQVESSHSRPPSPEPQEPPEPKYYPLAQHVRVPALLGRLIRYLSYYDWCVLSSLSKEFRDTVPGQRELEEVVLERYLGTVGYMRWVWRQPEPVALTLQDLHYYLRGVYLPSHQYARLAEEYLQPQSTVQPRTIRDLQASCRSFTRLVLRLRAQAEAEAEHNARMAVPIQSTQSETSRSPPPRLGTSRTSSRAPSPTSSFSHSHSYSHAHAHNAEPSRSQRPVNKFQSPLFRPRRAPLLRVFVPSPEGSWLSDVSVLECEAELKRTGVVNLMRAGDVVWDIAVGDEANLGRMVWDGSYLIDLDYTYSRVGDLPKYLPALAFPPSYFHRVIRTMGTGNPVVHIDISPWGEQIASNLQLLQDRMRTETPQGGQHTVVRWVHRSSFTIKPPIGTKSIRIPVPSSAGPGPSPSGAWIVDPGWYGTVVVEAEGTNEGLADLQDRCKGAFPPRAVGASSYPNPEQKHKEGRKTVFRLLRERSRPGEIWLRTVREKERLLPPS